MKNLYLNEIKGNVLFLGDSITDDGRFISFLNTYFRLYLPDCDISFFNLGVSSETLSGLSEEEHPFPRPCLFGRLEKTLETIKPQWVISMYGINDGIYSPFNEDYFDAFKNGYLKLAEKVKSIGAEFIAVTPIPFDTISYSSKLADDNQEKYGFMNTYKGYNDVMARYSLWLTEEMPKHSRFVVDIFGEMTADREALRKKNPNCKVGDGVHPDLHGHLVMAKVLLKNIFGLDAEHFINTMAKDRFRLFKLIYNHDKLIHSYYKETVGHDNIYKDNFLPLDKLNLTAEKSNSKIAKYINNHKSLKIKNSFWKGFKKTVFYFEGNEAVIVFPSKYKKNSNWVWRTEFFGAFPSADIAMLKKGYHVVHLAIPNRFGSPAAVSQMKSFNDFIIKKYNLNNRSILFGFSRGGLYALHYAAMYPQNVSALYLDAPVVDIRSWPFGYFKGCGSEADSKLCLKAFDFNSADEYASVLDNVINAVIKAKIPLIIVAGDNDEVVPFNENGLILKEKWEKENISFSLILKEGVGHHPHSLKNPKDIVDFLTKNKL